jgi:hypothetical protein
MDKFAPFLLKDFQDTIKYWKGEKPRFIKALIVRDDYIEIQIRAVGPEKGKNKWLWLNEGTRPHKIRAKNAPALRFRRGYGAGSSPNSTFVIASRKATGAMVRKDEVNHPGIKARNWTSIIIRENQKLFERWMNAAMEKAARASGHQIK